MRCAGLALPSILLAVALVVLSGCSSEAPSAQPSPAEPAVGTSAAGGPTQADDAAEAAAPTAAPSGAASPSLEVAPTDWKKSADGHWCYFPMEDSGTACWTIKYPKLTYDSGEVDRLNRYGGPSKNGDGSIEYSVTDAPLGTYYPAGVKMRDSSVKCGKISQDRMYSSQSGACMLRQEDIVKKK